MEEEGFFSHRLKLMVMSLLVLVFLYKVLNMLWWRPRKIEQHFRKQGIKGPPYIFLIGNAKEIVTLMLKASSQPMPLSHNILPRVLSFYHHWRKIYGATFLMWFGATVRLTVSDPDLIREIFTSKSEFYEKNESHPLIKQLEVAANSVSDMLDKWVAMSDSGEVEIEVSEWFQTLTEDIITRTVFGSSYKDGKAIFRLQAQLMALTSEAFQKVFIPGYRFLPTRRNMKSWKLDKEVKKSLVNLIERRRRRENRCNKTQEARGPKDLLGLMIRESWKEMEMDSNSNSNSSPSAKIMTVCGARDVPTKDDIPKLKTLSMILNETLRLYPPIVATIRRAKADVELGGCKIPCTETSKKSNQKEEIMKIN
ncbi:hypothetical protein RHSIM_Rhsim03G0246000 [Rhododendron simsii]|uniref:Cytochrome P450 n=1 Tax=Rhododendron simsii TaxID=118357 RepID=A0A834HB52_RHOSS|nr:hypothetical protein RHSIM_Rhsim03G0246000 [Rhododendron simsii]